MNFQRMKSDLRGVIKDFLKDSKIICRIQHRNRCRNEFKDVNLNGKITGNFELLEKQFQQRFLELVEEEAELVQIPLSALIDLDSLDLLIC